MNCTILSGSQVNAFMNRVIIFTVLSAWTIWQVASTNVSTELEMTSDARKKAGKRVTSNIASARYQ